MKKLYITAVTSLGVQVEKIFDAPYDIHDVSTFFRRFEWGGDPIVSYKFEEITIH